MEVLAAIMASKVLSNALVQATFDRNSVIGTTRDPQIPIINWVLDKI